MAKPYKLALLCGGKAVEHEHAVKSALYILAHINAAKYDVHILYIDREGRLAERKAARAALLTPLKGNWDELFSSEDTIPDDFTDRIRAWVDAPYSDAGVYASGFELLLKNHYDVAFPVFHGQAGEDGQIQGLLDCINLPYAGCDLTGTVAGNDKELAKRLVRDIGIPVADFNCIYREDWEKDRESIKTGIAGLPGYPAFVKPAGLGSSIGISRIESPLELDGALDIVFRYNRKAVVEKALNVREFGVGVIGNSSPSASLPLEFGLPEDGFLDYASKYGEESQTDTIPARIPNELQERLQSTAVKAYRALCLSGMARIDLFLSSDKVLFNEANTVPGFGRYSVFSKIWAASGIPLPDLIDKIVSYGLELHREKQKLNFRYK
ncbi:MAG: D-alanine--D-alanine ligase [Spirochaetales bacterium]|nr:D-alanine--D-alanine ligase [Spirochaetales bacterium]